MLYLDQENYMLNKMTQNSGAKILVHDPWLSPLLDEFSIDLQPATAASIALQVVSRVDDVESVNDFEQENLH